MVFVNDPPSDAQTEAGAATASSEIGLKEAIEDSRLVARRNAGAVVTDRDVCHPIRAADAKTDVPSCPSKARCIVEQDPKELLERVNIPHHARGRGIDRQHNIQINVLRLTADIGDERSKVDYRALQMLPSVRAGER